MWSLVRQTCWTWLGLFLYLWVNWTALFEAGLGWAGFLEGSFDQCISHPPGTSGPAQGCTSHRERKMQEAKVQWYKQTFKPLLTSYWTKQVSGSESVYWRGFPGSPVVKTPMQEAFHSWWGKSHTIKKEKETVGWRRHSSLYRKNYKVIWKRVEI